VSDSKEQLEKAQALYDEVVRDLVKQFDDALNVTLKEWHKSWIFDKEKRGAVAKARGYEFFINATDTLANNVELDVIERLKERVEARLKMYVYYTQCGM